MNKGVVSSQPLYAMAQLCFHFPSSLVESCGKINIHLSASSQFVRIDSDDEGDCEDLLFPGEGEVTDAAVVLLRKKMSGKYTLFKVWSNFESKWNIYFSRI